jgi:hypothetical protein
MESKTEEEEFDNARAEEDLWDSEYDELAVISRDITLYCKQHNLNMFRLLTPLDLLMFVNSHKKLSKPSKPKHNTVDSSE